MRKLLVTCGLFLSACATTSGAGKSGASAPFPGKEVAEKRRNEVMDAGKVGLECMKGKDVGGAGGIFAVTADANGKMTAEQVKWDGSPDVAKCVIDSANKTTLTPLPGAPVGVLWTFWAPGKEPAQEKAPDDTGSKIAGMQADAQNQIDQCAKTNLGQDFYAEVQVTVFVDANGKGWVPTLTNSTAKDGGFDGCVLDVLKNEKYPQLGNANPVPLPLNFKVGISDGLGTPKG